MTARAQLPATRSRPAACGRGGEPTPPRAAALALGVLATGGLVLAVAVTGGLVLAVRATGGLALAGLATGGLARSFS